MADYLLGVSGPVLPAGMELHDDTTEWWGDSVAASASDCDHIKVLRSMNNGCN